MSATYRSSDRSLAVGPFVDTLGVMLAATAEPERFALDSWSRTQAKDGPAVVLGLWAPAQASLAAFVNGTFAHLLDYDDVSTQLKGHPSAVLVPTILAVGSAVGASGTEALDAYLAGLDAADFVASGLDINAHYARGWHPTSTVGVLAATAAACRLMGLSLDAVRCALGMAASFASGSRQNFGTMTKSLHVGRAAEAAVMTAFLASCGGTADRDQLEGALGFFELFGKSMETSAIDRRIVGETLIRNGITVKQYPCCFHAHRAVDAAIELHSRVEPATIASVDVTVQPRGSSALLHHRPTDGMQAKFSGEYCVAAALIVGELGLENFSTSALQQPEIQSLLQRVTLTEASVPPAGPRNWEKGYAVVRLQLEGGRSAYERIDIPSGDPRRPVSTAARRQKFRQCLAYAGLANVTETCLAQIEGLDDRESVKDLLDAVAADANGMQGAPAEKPQMNGFDRAE